MRFGCKTASATPGVRVTSRRAPRIRSCHRARGYCITWSLRGEVAPGRASPGWVAPGRAGRKHMWQGVPGRAYSGRVAPGWVALGRAAPAGGSTSTCGQALPGGPLRDGLRDGSLPGGPLPVGSLPCGPLPGRSLRGGPQRRAAWQAYAARRGRGRGAVFSVNLGERRAQEDDTSFCTLPFWMISVLGGAGGSSPGT